MGGLQVTPKLTAPRFDFEMVFEDDGALYMHFRVGHACHLCTLALKTAFCPGVNEALFSVTGRPRMHSSVMTPPCGKCRQIV